MARNPAGMLSRDATQVPPIRRGMTMDPMEHTYKLEYRVQERIQHPYPGLQDFLDTRGSRDYGARAGREPG